MNQEICSSQASPVKASTGSACVDHEAKKNQEMGIWKKNKAASESLRGCPLGKEEADQSKKYPDITQ